MTVCLGQAVENINFIHIHDIRCWCQPRTSHAAKASKVSSSSEREKKINDKNPSIAKKYVLSKKVVDQNKKNKKSSYIIIRNCDNCSKYIYVLIVCRKAEIKKY